jgi:hypothetical protein
MQERIIETHILFLIIKIHAIISRTNRYCLSLFVNKRKIAFDNLSVKLAELDLPQIS